MSPDPLEVDLPCFGLRDVRAPVERAHVHSRSADQIGTFISSRISCRPLRRGVSSPAMMQGGDMRCGNPYELQP